MLNLKAIEKYDKKFMHKIYDNWPELANQAYQSKHKKIKLKNINHIVFSGMGGSGTLGDIFSSIFSSTNIHVDVVKGYKLPKTVSKTSLVVITSVSGNTSETISVLNEAIKNKYKIIVFSSGGEVIKICKKHKMDYRIIPQQLNPRTSLIGYLYSMLRVLEPIIPITEKEIKNSIVKLEKTRKIISSQNLHSNNPAIKLAKSINQISVIYFPFGLGSAAIRFKNSLQENTKMHVITEDIIEACHNGIVSWESNLKNINPILIQGKNDNVKTKKHWAVLKEFFSMKKIKFNEVNSLEGDILSKIINLIYLLDYTSIYRAIIDQIDPFPVEAITYIKKRV